MAATQLPELLAPAGSWEALKAAIGAGADAVYIGGKKYGARGLAQNFTQSQIQDALKLAHSRDVRIYVAVNTLIEESELPAVTDYLLWLYENGADGVLVQDVGLAAVARQVVPNLPLHASTQLTINTTEGVQWAVEQGFRRVVLARELSLTDIEKIARYVEHLPVGLEVFIHGALCFCYSGQCLLSSSIGGRSGNRGFCAQPCRKPYRLVKCEVDDYDCPISKRTLGKERYYLSTQDLCTYLELDRIVGAPITSLKIEGRMKSPEYVAIVVSIYRNALDAIKRGEWEPSKEEIQNLLLAFNRGFTHGYLLGAGQRDIIGGQRPANQGLCFGEVEAYNPSLREVEIRVFGNVTPQRGDGILFQSRTTPKEDFGMKISMTPDMSGNTIHIPVPHPVRTKTLVSITSRSALEKRAQTIIKNFSTPIGRLMEVDLVVEWGEGNSPILHGNVHRRTQPSLPIAYHSPQPWTIAKGRPLSSEQILTQLCRTGDTPFTMKSCTLNYPGNLFTPIGRINKIRREFIETIEHLFHTTSLPSLRAVNDAKRRYGEMYRHYFESHATDTPVVKGPPSLAVYVSTMDAVHAAIGGGYDCIYLEPEIHSNIRCESHASTPYSRSQLTSELIKILLEALHACEERGITFAWKWPRITSNAYHQFGHALLPHLHDRGLSMVMVDSIGAANVVKATVPQLSIAGSYGLNVWNHYTIDALQKYFDRVTLSPELSLKNMNALITGSSRTTLAPILEFVVQGNLEVMVSENCVLPNRQEYHQSAGVAKGIRRAMGLVDQKQRLFPITIDEDNRTHIYNSVETCLIDYLPHLYKIGVTSFAVDGRHRQSSYINDMAAIYRQAINYMHQEDKAILTKINQLKYNIKKISRGGITVGPYHRRFDEYSEVE